MRVEGAAGDGSCGGDGAAHGCDSTNPSDTFMGARHQDLEVRVLSSQTIFRIPPTRYGSEIPEFGGKSITIPKIGRAHCRERVHGDV